MNVSESEEDWAHLRLAGHSLNAELMVGFFMWVLATRGDFRVAMVSPWHLNHLNQRFQAANPLSQLGMDSPGLSNVRELGRDVWGWDT